MTDLSPRQWGKGDPEPPADVKILKGLHFAKRGLQYVVRCSGGGWLWSHQQGTDVRFGLAWENAASLARGPLTEVLPERAKSARGHRNGCQGCDHDPRAYPTCWTDEQVAEHQALLRPPAQQLQDGSISSSVGGGDGETVTDELRAKVDALIPDVKQWFTDLRVKAAGDPSNISDEAQDLLERVLLLDAPSKTSPGESEWEWGWRLPGGEYQPATEYAARRFCSIKESVALVRRPTGPWEQVEQS